MKYFVYVLRHTYSDETHTNTKTIGFFNSIEDLNEIKERAILLPGFKKYQDSFVINFYILDKIHWNNGFQEVVGEIGRDYIEKGDIVREEDLSIKELGINLIFVLSHSYTVNTYLDDERYIGVFSSLDMAEKAVNILKTKPGFSNYPDDFHIGEIYLKEMMWETGFGEP